MKACFMGLGYIGLPTSIIAARHGVQVVGVDINPQVVEMTNQGRLHIIEPGMKEMLQEVVNNGCLHANHTPEISDAYFIVVPTWFLPHLKETTNQTSPMLSQPHAWYSLF